MGRVFGLEGMGRHASGPLLRLHRDGWLSWRVAKEAPYPLTAARLFPIHTEFPAWLRHQKRFGAQKSSRADGMAGQGICGKASARPVVAARATQARRARGFCLFSPGAASPGIGGGRRTLGLVRSLGYAGCMSTHSRSFPAPRRGALHEEQDLPDIAGPAGSRQGREKTFSAPPSQRGQGQPGAGRGQARPVPPFRASCFRGAGSAGSRPGQNGPGQEGGTAGTCRRGVPCPAPLAAGAPGTAARGTAAGAGVSGPSLARPATFGPAQRRFQRAGGGA